MWVYVVDKKSSEYHLQLSHIVSGDATAGRFGSSMISIGDVDLDGYNGSSNNFIS